MRKNISMIIRWVLTIIIVYLSYRETGWATALSLLLIFIGIEGVSILLKVSTAETKRLRHAMELLKKIQDRE